MGRTISRCQFSVLKDEILACDSTKTRDISVSCESVVSICYLNPVDDAKVKSYLHTITVNAETICKNKTSTVRNDAGDKGQMYALGCRLYPKEKGIISYVGNKHVSHILPNAVEAMEYLGCMAFPSIVRPIQDMEQAAGCECLPCMEKIQCHTPPNNTGALRERCKTSWQKK
jgi:hypothetical protein